MHRERGLGSLDPICEVNLCVSDFRVLRNPEEVQRDIASRRPSMAQPQPYGGTTNEHELFSEFNCQKLLEISVYWCPFVVRL